MFSTGDEVRMIGAPVQRGVVVEVSGAKIVVQYPPTRGELAPIWIDYAIAWEFDPELFLEW